MTGHARGDGSLMRIKPFQVGEQGRVDVDDASRKPLYEGW